MNIEDVAWYLIVGFGWGMLFTMVAECFSGGRFIEIFFPKKPPEIIMTTFEEVTDEEDNKED